MNDFERENWIVSCIVKSYPHSCEWGDPTTDDRRIVDKLVAQGLVYASSSRNKWSGLCVQELSFTKRGAEIYIRESDVSSVDC